jgi:hypothetical protein
VKDGLLGRVRALGQRLRGRRRRDAIERETEEAGMSPAERRLRHEPIEDLQADRFVDEHLGGTEPPSLER